MPRRKLVAGNWKMNGLAAAESELKTLAAAHPAPDCDVLVCPPATLIARFAARTADGPIAIGGQDCHWAESGAHTGDLSAEMLRDAGASAVIVGHSERRADHHENNTTVREKAKAAWRAGLMAIVCVGETEAQRDAGETQAVVGGQVDASVPDGATATNTVVAYEPVWAIGTGRTATTEQIAEVHDDIRARLVSRFGAEGQGMRILYGGSVKPGNAAEIFAVENVDGGLVGGASLKAADFGEIVKAG